MTPLYERTIIGWPLMIFILIMTVFLIVMLIVFPSGETAWFSLALLIIPLILGVMKISVTVEELKIRFLPGIPRLTIKLNDIDSMMVIHSWIQTGFGISVKPLQGRYCISGPTAVSIMLRNGRTVLVGTPEPEKLLKALNRARDRHAGRS